MRGDFILRFQRMRELRARRVPAEKPDAFQRRVRKLMRTELPVEKLPWMDEHGDGMPTPHAEG